MNFQKLLFLLFFLKTVAYGQTSISGIVNLYTKVTSVNIVNCKADLNVISSTGYSNGDRVLIIQMKGAQIDSSNSATFGNIQQYNGAGFYEFNWINSISGNIINLKNPLINSYNLSGLVQLIKVPQYSNVTISGILTAAPWDGNTGGVLAIEATGQITLNAGISVDGLGFRGGNVSNHYYNFDCSYLDYYYDSVSGKSGTKGEGISGPLTNKEAGRGALANGGGGGNTVNAGGGGGGNYGSGGRGGDQWEDECPRISIGGEGGYALNYISNPRILLGGGGGGGQKNNNAGSNGTNGGGIIILKGNEIIGNNKIVSANGINNTSSSGDDGSGGGGAGGSIFLDINSFTGLLNIEAKGGKGGNVNSIKCHGPGGGGGGGIIWKKGGALPGNVTSILSGGLAGIHTNSTAPCFNTSYGAFAGQNGAVLTNLILSENPIELTNDTTICAGDTLTLTASGGTAYQWSNGSVASSISISPAGSTTYYVGITNNGCIINDSITVIVNSIATDITGDTIICIGDSTTLTAQGGSSYQWSGGVSAFTSSIIVSPNISTTYYVTITNNNCSKNDSIKVSVITASPVATITGDSVICEGDTTILFAFGGASYLWSGNGINSTSQDIMVSPLMSTTYMVIVSNGNCGSDSVSVSVTVNPLPSVSVSNDTLICEKDTALLTATGGISYQWSGSISSTNDSVYVNPASSIIYYVTAFDSTCRSLPDSISVVVNPLPVISLTGDTMICEGESTTLTAAGASSYNWGNGDTSSSINVNPLIDTIYSVVASDGVCQSDTQFITVSVKPVPIAAASLDTIICKGSSAILIASGGITYEWSGGGVSDTTNPLIVNPNITTQYFVKTSNGACYSPSDSVLVTVNTLPEIIVTGNTDICEGDSAILSASGALNYQWAPGNISGTSGITVYPAITITYNVTGNDGKCNSKPVSILVNVSPITKSEFSSTLEPCDPVVYFKNTVNDTTSLLWNFGDGNTSAMANPQYIYKNSGTYVVQLIVNPNVSCADTMQYSVQYEYNGENYPLYIPNTITVNDDGLNDKFEIKGGNICNDYQLMIFNRWGQLIYETNDIYNYWDGTYKGSYVQEDTYVYVVKGKNLHRSGTVTVIK